MMTTTTLIEALSAYIEYSNKLKTDSTTSKSRLQKGLEGYLGKKKNQNIWTQCTP